MAADSSLSRHITPATPMARRMDKATRAVVAGLTRMGISLMGSRILSVRGRTTGQWRSLPVNPLSINGSRYLVSPRGQTQWVLNMRAAGGGRLQLGRKVEEFTVAEVADDQKPDVLREYLRRWKFEVSMFFDGVDASAPEEKLREIAPGYPVFEVRPAR